MTLDRYTRRGAGYVGRFTLVHVFAYAVVGTTFLFLQSSLPQTDRVALTVFEPYRPLDLSVVLSQAARGAVIAIILAPFYDDIVGGKRRWVALFVILWGLTIVGSIEPMPGSIEGVIYTETTALAHLVVLAATAVQIGLLAWIFLWWETGINDRETTTRAETVGDGLAVARNPSRRLATYVGRFALLYALVYLIAGLTFFLLQDYESVFETGTGFELYRPLDHPFVQFAVVIQLVRGGLLALLVVPFHGTIFESKHGWIFLFGLLWGLTFLGAPNAIQGLVGDLVSGAGTDLLFGTAEITVQMGLFSWVLWRWERRARARRSNGG